jgi:hypothetical protein
MPSNIIHLPFLLGIHFNRLRKRSEKIGENLRNKKTLPLKVRLCPLAASGIRTFHDLIDLIRLATLDDIPKYLCLRSKNTTHFLRLNTLLGTLFSNLCSSLTLSKKFHTNRKQKAQLNTLEYLYEDTGRGNILKSAVSLCPFAKF